MKYRIDENDSIIVSGRKLFRIVALKSFYDVTEGEKGGYIQEEDNLSQYGNAWVSGNAQVYGDAKVYGNAQVSGDAQVYGNAWVYGDAQVYGNARVYGDAWVYGNAQVSGDALVQNTPKFISGLKYHVTITETHAFVGCQGHTIEKWKNFTKEEINKMDGKSALEFYPVLINLLNLLGE